VQPTSWSQRLPQLWTRHLHPNSELNSIFGLNLSCYGNTRQEEDTSVIQHYARRIFDSRIFRASGGSPRIHPSGGGSSGWYGKDKSSELNDFVSAIKALGKNAAKSGKVREPELFNGRTWRNWKPLFHSVAFTSKAPPTRSKTRPVISPLRYPISRMLL